MTKTSKIALSILAAGAMALGAQAAPITGSITFDGGVTLDTGSVNTATEVVNWFGNGGVGSPYVGSASGSFGSIAPNTAVAFSAPWLFNTTTPINNFWNVGGFNFSLTSSHVVFQAAGNLTVNGLGVITGGSFVPTQGTWSFSTQDPSATAPNGDAIFTFSAATGATGAVPESGTTAILLGFGLTALALFAKYGKPSVA